MGSIYRRGDKLWMQFKASDGTWRNLSTKYPVGKEREAKRLLALTEARILAGAKLGGPVTVERYSKQWIEDRIARGIRSARDDESRFRRHIWPVLGALKLQEVRPRHLLELVRGLQAKGKLAPRSIRHVYAIVRALFHDAVAEELVEANPCVLKRFDLPKRIDKDPAWREGAIFDRGEIELLISDGRTPPDRRLLCALMSLAGLRFGEAAALTWNEYDDRCGPLGKLLVCKSYSVKTKEVKGVKTEVPRPVPVHPLLAELLAEWKREGWPTMMGRAPTATDLIVPSREGDHRSANHGLKKFHADLARLGLRRRRQHDLRATFITLAQVDGAQQEILEWITHGPRGNITNVYTRFPWAARCEQVAKLKIRRLSADEIAERLNVTVGGVAAGGEVVRTAVVLQRPYATLRRRLKRRNPSDFSEGSLAGWTGLEGPTVDAPGDDSSGQNAIKPGGCGRPAQEGAGHRATLSAIQCSNAVSAVERALRSLAAGKLDQARRELEKLRNRLNRV